MKQTVFLPCHDGHGDAAGHCQHHPIAADISAMGEALQLVAGGGEHFHSVAFGVITVLLQVFVPYRKLAPILKWLTLFLFSYVIAVFMVQGPWGNVLYDLVVPKLQWTSGYWMMIVALLGTTIAPNLFFLRCQAPN